SKLVLPEVTAITATSVPANTFTPPPPFPGAPPSPPVPVAFCRVQITVEPQVKIEVWLPPTANWNHRFQAEGGGGYAGRFPTRRLPWRSAAVPAQDSSPQPLQIPDTRQPALPMDKVVQTARWLAVGSRSIQLTTRSMKG